MRIEKETQKSNTDYTREDPFNEDAQASVRLEFGSYLRAPLGVLWVKNLESASLENRAGPNGIDENVADDLGALVDVLVDVAGTSGARNDTCSN